MPLYTYTEKKSGKQVVRMVPIAARDQQRGLERVAEFPRGRLGLAENPYSQEYGVRQGLKDMEDKYGRDGMQKQLGADLPLNLVKEQWRN